MRTTEHGPIQPECGRKKKAMLQPRRATKKTRLRKEKQPKMRGIGSSPATKKARKGGGGKMSKNKSLDESEEKIGMSLETFKNKRKGQTLEQKKASQTSRKTSEQRKWEWYLKKKMPGPEQCKGGDVGELASKKPSGGRKPGQTLGVAAEKGKGGQSKKRPEPQN